MAPVFKKFLRDVLDHASTGGPLMFDDGCGMFDDEEIDENEEVSQQRLRIPGTHNQGQQAQSGLGWVRASADGELSMLAAPGRGIYEERRSADTERTAASSEGRSSDDLDMPRPITLPCPEYKSSLFFSTTAVRGASSGDGPGAASGGVLGVHARPGAAMAAVDAQAYSSGADHYAPAATVHTCRRRGASGSQGLRRH